MVLKTRFEYQEHSFVRNLYCLHSDFPVDDLISWNSSTKNKDKTDDLDNSKIHEVTERGVKKKMIKTHWRVRRRVDVYFYLGDLFCGIRYL